jgi:hypothetical protein
LINETNSLLSLLGSLTTSESLTLWGGIPFKHTTRTMFSICCEIGTHAAYTSNITVDSSPLISKEVQMQRSLKRAGILTGVLAGTLAGSLAMADTFQVNPSALPGNTLGQFNADFVDGSYQATVNQTAPAGGACSVASPCTFNETGTISFSTFRQGDFPGTPVSASTSGLNLNGTNSYALTGTFTGSGTAIPFGDGIRADFDTFNLSLSANGTPVGSSTGLIEGQANVFGPALAQGDFDVRLNFQPQGEFFSGLDQLSINTATLTGVNTSVSGVTLGSFTGATISGSGNLQFTTAGPGVIPEPSSILLLGSGLAGLGWFRRRFRS